MTKFDYWWIRGFDFPRVQISILISANIVLAVFVYDFHSAWNFIILALLFFALVYQLVQIFPYTLLAPKQVMAYGGSDNRDNISILVSNVLTSNRDYDKLVSLTHVRNPDILLTLESDKNWEDALAPLEAEYVYSVKAPLDNLYGMHLYSRLPLENMEVRYLVKDDIPSIHGEVMLPNGKKASIHCLHPRPPSPGESKTSTNRDAELLLVGREIEEEDELVLVFGDLNDVAWSRTTRLFQKMSGLLDPRRGRGLFNTYNAEYWLLRWPLDHVFHSKDFTLIELAREKNIGSDHFPMYTRLNYSPRAKWKQEGPKASGEEEHWAREKIKKAGPKEGKL